MSKNYSWRSRRSSVSRVNIAIPAYRLDALLMNGVWLHPTSMAVTTELKQWYDLEFRVPTPPTNEGWPR